MKSSAEVLGSLKLGFMMEHLPVFIGKVSGWFGGKENEVCFRLIGGSKHAWD